MKADTVRSATEVRHLKACINDLIGIQALPAIWDGELPPQIVGTLLDVLLGMLRLDFAYAQLNDSIAGAPFETLRLASEQNPAVQPQEIGGQLNAWLRDIPCPLPLLVRNPVGDGDVSIVPMRLGQRDEIGVFVAGCVRADFPTPTEKLILNIAVNQAVMTLHEVRRLREKEQLAQELDQKVAQRTAELLGVNAELTNEINDRKRVQLELWRKEAYLAEAQKLSRTGSFGWQVSSGEIYWSDETYRIFEFGAGTQPTLELAFERIHPKDRHLVRQIIDFAAQQRKEFDFEHRLLMPDGSVKYLRVVGRPSSDRAGSFEFVGAVTDITERKLAEEELQQLVDFVPQIIVVLSPDGKWIHANRVAREYTGLTLDEYRSLDVIDRVIYLDDAEKMRAIRERALSGSDPFELEARLLGKDGVYRWFLFRYNPLVEQGRVRRWYASATEIESRKQEEERVRKENVRLEERTRIAQELHDTLLQSFLGASMQLGAALNSLPSDSPVKPKLDQILQLMERGIEEGRDTIQGLRSSDPHRFDLVLALSRVPQEHAVRPDMDFQVSVAGRQQPLLPVIRQEIYRIGKEALVNAFCHSRASRVHLELEYTDTSLQLRVRDNGCGIDLDVLQSGREGHWGLVGMRERATRIGGQLKIASTPAAGTEIELSIPSAVAFQVSSPCPVGDLPDPRRPACQRPPRQPPVE